MTVAPEVGSVLHVDIALHEALWPRVSSHDKLRKAIGDAIARRLSALATTLGIQAAARVTVSGAEAQSAVLRLDVDGTVVRYPDETLLDSAALARGRGALPVDTHATTVEWLASLLDTDDGGWSTVADLLGEFSATIVSQQPQVLLPAAHAEAYAARLLAGTLAEHSAATPAVVGGALRRVIEARIAIADIAAITGELRTLGPSAASAGALAERLIARLRADTIGIRAPRSFLRELTTRWAVEGETLFPYLRDAMSEELGLECPPMRFEADDTLLPGKFVFRLNHLLTSPIRALSTDTCVVNDTNERLQLQGFTAAPAVIRGTRYPGGVIALADAPRAEDLGLTVWSQAQDVVLCLADALRQLGWTLLHLDGVRESLRQLGTTAPTLVAAVHERVAETTIAMVLRALVREKVCVRNLQAILDVLLREPSGADEDAAGPDQAIANLVGRVRARLGREIAGKAARQTDTLIVYLVDTVIERAMAEAAPDAQLETQILTALRTEMAFLPATAQVPGILTFAESRRRLQEVVRAEFPRIAVLAHEELPPGLNVQAVARIRLE